MVPFLNLDLLNFIRLPSMAYCGMDVLRTTLVIGLVYAIWVLPIPGLRSRPIRDFTIWGMSYPFLFVLMLVLILMIWGLIGHDYGIQGLFFDDNPLLQFLNGV